MSVTINKPISKLKELFLAICLLSGEISAETIRKMKQDYGETQIKNNIIQSLKMDGYIKRISRKENGYGYQLTDLGLEYMKIKLPEKYNYDCFSGSNAYRYDKNVRYRNLTMSLLLYYLAQSQIDLSNNVDKVATIIKGGDVSVEQPFFISIKEMRKIHIRMLPHYGYRVFGWIVTHNSFLAVYLTDPQHPICIGREMNVHRSMQNILSYSKNDYSQPLNYRFLFLFRNNNDYIESFVGYKGRDTRHNFTSSVYWKYKLKYSAACIIEDGYDNISCIINNTYSQKINDTFIVSYNLSYYGISNSYQQFRYLYDDYRTAICWNLNPATIIEAFDMCRNDLDDNEGIVILCFEESFELLNRLIKRWRLNKNVYISFITKENVFKYIRMKDAENNT